MDIQRYINDMKEFHSNLLSFLELETEVNASNFESFLKSQKSREIISEILSLILRISNNHRRYSDFFVKIGEIISIMVDQIKANFTDKEIFDIFKSNKRMLLYLFDNKIIKPDISLIKKENNYDNWIYFITEIKPFLTEEEIQNIQSDFLAMNPNLFTVFEQKRQDGENDSYFSELIRNDSIDDFISHVIRYTVPLEYTIPHSIFETNPFLLKEKPSLIEYAAFYGSIQIFNYLRLNDVQMSPNLWLYAIHGKNPEIIHLLEENHIEPTDKTYKECLKESIKCHHNDIAIYIRDNFMKEAETEKENETNFDNCFLEYCFHYQNYSFLPDALTTNRIFLYLCKYNYYTAVNILIKNKSMSGNERIVLN